MSAIHFVTVVSLTENTRLITALLPHLISTRSGFISTSSKLTFTGFADLWTQNYKGAEDLTVFLSEPQLWYHLNKSFSVGGELEISSNFAGGSDAIKGRPTLGVKWNL